MCGLGSREKAGCQLNSASLVLSISWPCVLLCVCLYVNMCECVYVCMCLHVPKYVCVCRSVCGCERVLVCTFLCMCLCVFEYILCVSTWGCACGCGRDNIWPIWLTSLRHNSRPFVQTSALCPLLYDHYYQWPLIETCHVSGSVYATEIPFYLILSSLVNR